MFSRNFEKVFQVTRASLRRCSTKPDGPSKPVLTGERGYNKVTLVGRVGKDSEVRGSEARPVTIFPLATSIPIKMADGSYRQQTEWHRISIFRPGLRDMVARNVKKGDKVFLTGKITYSEYLDKDNNSQRNCTIIADEVIPFKNASQTETTGDEEETLD